MILVDNKLQIAKYRLAYIVTFIVGVVFTFFALFSKSPAMQNTISMIIGLLLFSIFCILLLIKPEYIYITIEKNTKIIFRNYSAFPLFRKYRAFEIPIKAVYDLEIKESFLGLRKFFRILVITKNMTGKYPWLSITAVPKKDLNTMIKTFNKILPADKKKNFKF